MTAITNYTTLVKAIKDAAEDDGTEFATYIPTAIDLVEERLYRELDLPELELKATGSFTTNVNTLAKPSGYTFGEYFAVIINGKRNLLQKRRDTYILDYAPTVTDVPKYYADDSETNFIVSPTPNTNYPYELKYTKKPEKLTSSNLTNYYTRKLNATLFYGCMAEMARFMKDWAQVDFWETEYGRNSQSWNVQAMRYRRDGGSLPMNPDGGPNSLAHTVKTNA